MIDSVGKDTLTTRHNRRAGPTGGFPVSYSGYLAGVLGFSRAYEIVSNGNGSFYYAAAHHPEC